MSFNSSDDGVEFFGGHVNMKYLIVVGAEDDSIDTDTGLKANLQYVIVVQNNNVHDTIIEADSNDFRNQTPRQNTQIANFTFIGTNTAADAGAQIFLRGGTDFALVNGIVVSPTDECLRIRHAETVQATGPDENGPPVFHSVVMQCAAPTFISTDLPAGTTAESVFNAGTNNNANYTPTLTNLFINGANESAVPAFNPQTLSSFFDATDYIGAVRPGDTWFQGWTCNSAAANFGNGNTGMCTSLPVYQ
jgi:hypothetical protein